MRIACTSQGDLGGCENENSQAVPVRPTASNRTFMGTVLVIPRLSKSVSLVKTSVMGFLEYVFA